MQLGNKSVIKNGYSKTVDVLIHTGRKEKTHVACLPFKVIQSQIANVTIANGVGKKKESTK